MSLQSGFAAWVGVDWADRRHVVCLREAGSSQVETQTLAQDPAAIHQWLRQLRRRFGGRPVAVALEQSRGALMYALMGYDFVVVYPINPRTVASYRKAFRVSGAKKDAGDARLLLEWLVRYQEQLQPWWPEEPAVRALRLLLEQRVKLVQERTRVVHRLVDHLKQYFPQVLEWFPDRTHPQCWEFVSRWSTLQSVQRARRETLRRQLQSWRWSSRRQEKTLEQMRTAVALTHDPAVLQVHPRLVRLLARQLQVLQDGIRGLEADIQEGFQSLPDAPLFASFTGAGAVYAPQLLVVYGTDRSRFDASSMQSFSGIAPVTEQSGSSSWVHHRRVCPTFVKQTFHDFARCSLAHSRWAHAYYHQQRQRGASHQQAIRSLAFKWIRILTRCWKNRTPYSEEKYLQALRRRNSPLMALIEAPAS